MEALGAIPAATTNAGKEDLIIKESEIDLKGDIYRQAYTKAVDAQKELCLGSYVFTWGHKQEATPTWFGLFLPASTPPGTSPS